MNVSTAKFSTAKWFSSKRRRRAFKVDRYIKSRDSFIIITDVGATCEVTADKLHLNGYLPTITRPVYAAEGGYKKPEVKRNANV